MPSTAVSKKPNPSNITATFKSVPAPDGRTVGCCCLSRTAVCSTGCGMVTRIGGSPRRTNVCSPSIASTSAEPSDRQYFNESSVYEVLQTGHSFISLFILHFEKKKKGGDDPRLSGVCLLEERTDYLALTLPAPL